MKELKVGDLVLYRGASKFTTPSLEGCVCEVWDVNMYHDNVGIRPIKLLSGSMAPSEMYVYPENLIKIELPPAE
jgi:hypothetical protein